MSIHIQKSGVLSTIQDLGRIGCQNLGINPSGAMDQFAARAVNILLGNDDHAAILEMYFPAPLLKFEKAARIAIGGADFGATIDGEPLERWRPLLIKENQTLKFTKKTFGNLAYLAIENGFAAERRFGSASTNLTAGFGGFHGRSLISGDHLNFQSQTTSGARKANYKISRRLIPLYSSHPTIRVVAGAEFENLTAESQRDFLERDFTITQNSNRMGFRLHGTPLETVNKIELVSAAVNFGTVQLLPDGQMIILMADHQTTGGYPRIAHVASVDLPILAQLGANGKVNFQAISTPEAERLMLDYETDLNFLRIGVNSKNVFD